MLRKRTLAVAVAIIAAGLAAVIVQAAAAHGRGRPYRDHHGAFYGATATPIQHLVVIIGENISFDHYFGTYPHAANTDGQPFHAAPGTPAVDGLLPATSPSLPPALRHSTNLLTSNPNLDQPQRLDSSPEGLPGDAGGQSTCDNDNNYEPEQTAFDGGKMDLFVQNTSASTGTSDFGGPCEASTVMDYYDGNSVTALWNYAQHYAMSDNSYGTTFGGTTLGHINVVSGDTGGVDMAHTFGKLSISTPSSPNGVLTPDGLGGYSLTKNADPYWDDCATGASVAMSGTNIGDELNAAGISWGYFKGGFRPTTTYAQATGGAPLTNESDYVPDKFANATFYQSVPNATEGGLCNADHAIGSALGETGQFGYNNDYSDHQEPFQYYASTANPHHLTVPTGPNGQDTLAGLKEIGHDTQSQVNGVWQFNTPNHQYDMTDFDQLVAAIARGELPPSALPAVSFLKASTYETGHAADSDPADEQQFVTREIDALERTPDWAHTAVVLIWDDSDGWYDHAFSGVTNPSLSPADNLTNTVTTGGSSGQCGTEPSGSEPLGDEQGRCGFGPRLPLLVISPYARHNYVDHNLSDQSSITNLIEYNWRLPGIPGSYDQALATTDRREGIPFDLAAMFDFRGPTNTPLFLNPDTGQPEPWWAR
ncbi:MAG TPA: alkaline phosphatase family protein [Solirubrobacteraceae bacterium]|nr:alkaline phosphatase family protein [Solirubrobacteraceae bacterium]